MDASLSTEQTEKILQFQDLTGIDNMTVCRDILQRHSWDLEVAVQDQLNMSEGRPSVFASENPPPTVINDSVVQRVFSTPPSSYNRWGGRLGYIFSYFVHFCYNSFISVLRLAHSLIWRDTRRAVTDPVGDVVRFVQLFKTEFGNNHPVFYQGSYSQALNDAKRELKFLLVYLHKDGDHDSTAFARECLQDARVVSLINSRMLFWGCNIASGEGSRVVSTLRAGGFPFLGVIVLREFRMTLVGSYIKLRSNSSLPSAGKAIIAARNNMAPRRRLEGPMVPDDVLSRLQDIVDINQQCLDAARADRVAREVAMVLRREQDQAYLESLRQDQEKERIKNQKQEEQLQKERDIQRKKQEIQDLKVDLVKDVVSEPASTHPDSVSIVFKLPTGERIERRFLSNHTLKDVYNYIFCHPLSPDSFELRTNFPKRTLQCVEEASKTLIDAGLQRKEVLFVHDLDA